MILADTSLWVDHLRSAGTSLAQALETGRVCIHDFVIGELACGNLKRRQTILEYLQHLPKLPSAAEPEVLYFIERHQLMGSGIGYIDAHLLAASAIHRARIWTRDGRLLNAARRIGLAFTPEH